MLQFGVNALLGIYFLSTGAYLLLTFQSTENYLMEYQKLNASVSGYLTFVNYIEAVKFIYVAVSLIEMLSGLLLFFGIHEGKWYGVCSSLLLMVTIDNPASQTNKDEMIRKCVVCMAHILIAVIVFVCVYEIPELKEAKKLKAN